MKLGPISSSDPAIQTYYKYPTSKTSLLTKVLILLFGRKEIFCENGVEVTRFHLNNKVYVFKLEYIGDQL